VVKRLFTLKAEIASSSRQDVQTGEKDETEVEERGKGHGEKRKYEKPRRKSKAGGGRRHEKPSRAVVRGQGGGRRVCGWLRGTTGGTGEFA